MIPTVEGPIERLYRAGGNLAELKHRLPPRPSVDQIIANLQITTATAYGEQDGNGVDLSLIRESLRLDVTDRLRKADSARRDVLRLRDHAAAATK